MRGHGPNYQRLSIRGGAGTTYRLMRGNNEMGTISDVHLFREAYVGAVYSHFGKAYRVVAHAAGEVHLEDVEPHLRTEGIFWTVTVVDELLAGHRFGESLATCYGRLTVFENFGGYRLIDTRSGTVVDEERSQLARTSNVRGFWLEIADASGLVRHELKDLFGVEQLLRVGAPFVVPCDRHDLGTLTSLRTPPASVYLYETVPGGIGVAEKALEAWRDIVVTGIRIAEACGCRHGCPSCLVPARLPSGFDEPRKEPAIALAQALLHMAEDTRHEEFDPALHSWRPVP